MKQLILLVLIGTLYISKATKAQAENKVGQVTANETQKISRRFEARQYTYFAIGPFVAQGANNDTVGHHLGAGYVWDATIHASIKLVGEGVINFHDPEVFLANVGLGANYFFTDMPISPFVSADFGYGGTATKDKTSENVVGFSLGGAIGIAFFRTSTAQLQLQLRQVTILEKNGSGYPGYYGLAVGLLY